MGPYTQRHTPTNKGAFQRGGLKVRAACSVRV